MIDSNLSEEFRGVTPVRDLAAACRSGKPWRKKEESEGSEDGREMAGGRTPGKSSEAFRAAMSRERDR
jgi:hypothetical protein